MPLHRGEGHLSLSSTEGHAPGWRSGAGPRRRWPSRWRPSGPPPPRPSGAKDARSTPPCVRGWAPPCPCGEGTSRRRQRRDSSDVVVGSPSRQLAGAPLTRCSPRPARHPGASPPAPPPAPERPGAPRSTGSSSVRSVRAGAGWRKQDVRTAEFGRNPLREWPAPSLRPTTLLYEALSTSTVCCWPPNRVVIYMPPDLIHVCIRCIYTYV